jgi:hypothetical protein
VVQVSSAVSLATSGSPSTAGQSVTFTASVAAVPPATGTPTGTVAFTDGVSAIAGCSAQPISAGTATCTTSSLTVGSHTVTATYGGDTNFQTSSNTVIQAVHGTTTTAITTSVSPSVVGQSVTLTASVLVTAPGTGSPTGTVVFKNGVAAITGCSAQPISSGSATCVTTSLPLGPHSLTAVYSGDTNFLTSTSGPVAETVGQAATNIVVTSDTDPAVAGQTVTFSASILVTPPGSGSPTVPTGVVAFKNGGVTISGCSAQVLSSATASCTTSALTVGTQSITASYNGDANFLAASSSAFTELVTQAVSSVTLVSTQPGGPGTPVEFVATVSGNGSVTPTGTISIGTAGGTTTLATCTLAGSGSTASCSASGPILPGSAAFIATYVGDANYAGSQSGPSPLTVQSVRARAR